MQVTGLSGCYVFINHRSVTWKEFEPERYTLPRFLDYVRNNFYSYYIKCINEIGVINAENICDWFYNYGYENGDTYTFISD